MKNLEKSAIDISKSLLKAIPMVIPFVRHRLHTAEITGVIPINMYKNNDIIDDAILDLYADIKDKPQTEGSIKLKLFEMVNARLEQLYKNESFHQKTMSTKNMLENELDLLDEKFEMDLDEDLLMPEELDDISYHQKDKNKPEFLYADAEDNIIRALKINDLRNEMSPTRRRALNKIYNWLPMQTLNVFDLYVFGKLNFDEIANIKNITAKEVENVITYVQKNIRKNLN